MTRQPPELRCQGREQGPTKRRLRLDELVERLAPEDQGLGGLDRDRRRRVGRTVEQGQLAEELAASQRRDDRARPRPSGGDRRSSPSRIRRCTASRPGRPGGRSSRSCDSAGRGAPPRTARVIRRRRGRTAGSVAVRRSRSRSRPRRSSRSRAPWTGGCVRRPAIHARTDSSSGQRETGRIIPDFVPCAPLVLVDQLRPRLLCGRCASAEFWRCFRFRRMSCSRPPASSRLSSGFEEHDPRCRPRWPCRGTPCCPRRRSPCRGTRGPRRRRRRPRARPGVALDGRRRLRAALADPGRRGPRRRRRRRRGLPALVRRPRRRSPCRGRVALDVVVTGRTRATLAGPSTSLSPVARRRLRP